jgi:gelsolin
MLKAKEYKVEDSNIALLGSDLEKKVKLAAAQSEKAWQGAGQKVGLQIWRIEKFQVVSWPKEEYGSFFDGDSYIVLRTYKKDPNSPALAWDVHFWLGKFTTQDEAGTAAYKTVELDDFLGGAPVQHREVQGHESDAFLKLFNNQIKLLSGGVDSGFKHVEPEKYRPRLLHLKGRRKIRVTEVELSSKSLNSGDVFVLDDGLTLLQWNGKKSGPMEKQKGAALCQAMVSERKGKAKVTVLEEQDQSSDHVLFWKKLGGQGPIKTAEEGGSDVEAEKEHSKIRKLFQLSDASGKLEFKLVAEGANIKKSKFVSNDAMIFDAGNEVFAWIGKGASKQEKTKALGFAQDYLSKYNRPVYLPITRVLEGGESETFLALLQ